MKKPVWQRETKWLGAEGVAAKEEAAIARRHGLTPKVVDVHDLLSRPEWKGSSTETVEGPTGQIVIVRHPSGAEARIVADVPVHEEYRPRKKDPATPMCRKFGVVTRATVYGVGSEVTCRECLGKRR